MARTRKSPRTAPTSTRKSARINRADDPEAQERARRKNIMDQAIRRLNLESDVWTLEVLPKLVHCGGCTKWIKLDQRSMYYPGLWHKHRDLCRCIKEKLGLPIPQRARKPKDTATQRPSCSSKAPLQDISQRRGAVDFRQEVQRSGTAERSTPSQNWSCYSDAPPSQPYVFQYQQAYWKCCEKPGQYLTTKESHPYPTRAGHMSYNTPSLTVPTVRHDLTGPGVPGRRYAEIHYGASDDECTDSDSEDERGFFEPGKSFQYLLKGKTDSSAYHKIRHISRPAPAGQNTDFPPGAS
ncbi:hypothetical protein H0H92_012639 [Tricholoma furcatifolium]|nr:hypothetical protein H0H92_012639 [Tricholoma furcatifolium]